MFEKVNPGHPDKVADRIAGAIVDLAYQKEKDPKIAVEVLLGHERCFMIIETSSEITEDEIKPIVERIAGKVETKIIIVKQDIYLAENQKDKFRCGDNGIFYGYPFTDEEKKLSRIAKEIYKNHPTDGKYILDEDRWKLIVCQSNAEKNDLLDYYEGETIVNPLGYWTGGINVDSGATNRKLGSDMGRAVSGGGLHGKDLSKGDVSINIYAHLKAQKYYRPVKICCAIGDEKVDGRPYKEIVEIAREYIKEIGGFEKFAEWGFMPR